MTTQNTALARTTTKAATARGATSAAFEPQTLDELMRFADYMADCGLLPEHLRGKPKDFVLIAIKGREMGFTLMQSIACINVIKGRTIINAEGVAAKVLAHPDCVYFQPVETTDAVATYETLRRGAPAPVRLSFTIEQARRAGLAGNENYRKHTEAMLRARCSMALGRAVFPDAVLGINEHGEGEEIAGRPLPVPGPATVEVVGATHVLDAPAEPAPVAALRTALAALGPAPSVWAAAMCWRDHAGDVAALGSADVTHDAQGLALDAVPRDVSAAEWRDVLAVLAAYGDHAALADFVDDLTAPACASLADVAACWTAHKGALAALPKDVGGLAWTAAVRRAGELAPDEKQPQKALKAALAKPPPEPPTGTDAPRSAANDAPAGDVHGDAYEGAVGTPADSPLAFHRGQAARVVDELEARLLARHDAWVGHLRAEPNAFAVARAFLKREKAFERAGVHRARFQATLDVLKPLLATDSDAEAIAFVRNQGRGKRAA